MPSQTAEHALRAVAYLASQGGERPLPADRVARALGAPSNYLSKTLHTLARAGVLRSTTGRRGGFSLARPADHIALATVLEVFDAPAESRICLLRDRPCDGTRPCRAHPVWSGVRRARRAPLAETTVGDLLRSGPCERTS